jgi:polyhydroxyalkanoate synthesis regulator phasin
VWLGVIRRLLGWRDYWKDYTRMPTQPPDFLNPDLLKDYQSFAQQSWDAWSKQWQQPGVAAPWFQSAAPAKPPMDEALERALGGFKGYLDWLQRAATSGVAQPSDGADWWQSLQPLFTAGTHPFMPPFAGFDRAFAGAAGQPWQGWLQAAQQGAQPGVAAGMDALRGMLQTPAFGYSREQQEQQQALALAMLEHQQASQRYQALMLRAQWQGAERLQHKLAERTEPGKQVESLKALYDLWVDAAEEAYAEIALSDEFRAVYAAQVNTQMRVKQLQQQQLEQWCREVGLPTRSEVASLGQRLQELRREMRQARTSAGTPAQAPADRAGAADVAELHAEIEALKQQLQASRAATAGSKQTARSSAAKPPAAPSSQAKSETGKPARAATKTTGNTTTAAPSRRGPATAATPRKRR